ncbi:MAG: dephospho-CoA kinase [Phycisphaeraceae bacterium]|nr:MAG: dephospho-CoA kinase [Phycisphaeraceae bacterium]
MSEAAKGQSGSGKGSAGGRFLVIGLAGGIGSGKSAVARSFGRLGLVVLDSDEAAKAELDVAEVRDQIVAWWGAEILGADGRVDRRRVADIVFADKGELRRLEGLVHPRLRVGRERAIAEARREGRPGAVIDAPLLFEAGVDGECDEVVFVEASRGVRLERVQRSRGWSEDDFARREAVQWGLDEKRARCGWVIVNESASQELLDREVERVYAEMVRARGG